MFARIKIIVDKAKNTIVVPKEFINTDNNNNKYLYIVKDKIVLKTIVTTGLESDDMIEINSGINENDIVTSANISHLKDKSKILIWNDIKGGEKNDIN
jgi:multidrug efflux pump subunit AcrA (membrane-fusion protein)